MKQRFILAILAAVSCATAASFGAQDIVLRAEDVAVSTNFDWLAFARAEQTLRAGGNVEFRLPPATNTTFSILRRAIWLAALHGIKRQTFADDRSRTILSNEWMAAAAVAREHFVYHVAVRESPSAENLFAALCDRQVFPRLVGANEPCDLPTVLHCTDKGIGGERSGVIFPSAQLAGTFTQASHADEGLVFESDGTVARDIFLRCFGKGQVALVNLTSLPRQGLLLRRRIARTEFALPPAGVLILQQGERGRPLSRKMPVPFVSSLWCVNFQGGAVPRLIHDNLLSTVVSETYRGRISYQADVMIPPGEMELLLRIETGGEPAQVIIGGIDAGVRAWEPFEWRIPLRCRGRTVPIEIVIDKQTLEGFLQAAPSWRTD